MARDRISPRAGKENSAVTKVSALHNKKWVKNKKYRQAYEDLARGVGFLDRAVIKARVTAGLTQEQLAQRMGTTQSVVARLESRRTRRPRKHSIA